MEASATIDVNPPPDHATHRIDNLPAARRVLAERARRRRRRPGWCVGGASFRGRRLAVSPLVFQPSRAGGVLRPRRTAAKPLGLPGFSVQGGYRFNRIQINSGTSSDTTIIQEGWFFPR